MTGTGTQTDPYLIYDAADLEGIKNLLGGEGVYCKQMAHIDLSPISSWTPIVKFVNYNGNGYKISNLMGTGGLFGDFYNVNVRIENVTLENVNINSTAVYTGGICGRLGGMNNARYATIYNCHVTGTITSASSDVGGIVGRLSGILTHCSFNGTIQGDSNVGGIVGRAFVPNYSNVVVTDCISYGQVKGRNYVGGIIGDYYNNGSKTIPDFARHTSYATVSGLFYVGGIFGGVRPYYGGDNAKVTNCVANNPEIRRLNGAELDFGRVVGRVSGTVCENNKALSSMQFITQ